MHVTIPSTAVTNQYYAPANGFSHLTSLVQVCNNSSYYTDSNFPYALNIYSSTSGSNKLVQEGNYIYFVDGDEKLVGIVTERDIALSLAGIASRETAELYGLDIIAPNIQTIKNNSTRFITISKQLIIPADANKISVVFSVPHSVGALNRVLNRFCMNGLNLTKIESRAAKNGEFDYIFYLDFSGNLNDRKTIALISSLEQELPDFTFLGNYKETTIK